jgi:hypothetical protein
VVLTVSGISGNAATRLESFVTSGGAFSFGSPTGLGPRVEDITANAIPGFYMAPYEDLKLKRP